ncbi:ABATE domain-containing protein [Streptomyces coeruleoprunus]|uniref:ABATE domain-containing protein n=1 Tax=Streptomyces coeruleoprunus TaxID=285563 RepID=UPI0035E83B31
MAAAPQPLAPDPAADLALRLALTIRHDGQGGVADDLVDPDGLTRWVHAHAAALPAGELPFTADDAALAAVRDLRAAVRALFARAVPGEPSRADARHLMPVEEALRRLNAAAAAVPVVPHLTWPPGDGPAAGHRAAAAGAPAAAALTAALAHAAIAVLAGPDRTRLRACHAPRCVRYFLKDHPRQEWCSPSCGNRARVARHHDRHRPGAGT